MPAETRRAIVDDLRAGKSHNTIAKDRGVNQSTVSRIALAEGIPSINAAPKKAIAAKATYDQERRQEFSDQLFDQLKTDVKNGVSTKDVIMGFAILTDKRRLEEGKATERHEHSDTDRGAVTRRMDELAARRGARGVVRESDRTPSEVTGS